MIHRFDSEVHDVATEADGTVWVALGAGVGRWRDGQVSVLELEPEGTGARHVLLDESQVVWAGTSVGLYRLSDAEFERIAEPDAASWRGGVVDISQDSRGRLWAPTPDAILYGNQQGEFRVYENKELPGAGVREVIEDRDGDLWFLYPDGLRRVPAAVEDDIDLGRIPTFVPLDGAVALATGAGRTSSGFEVDVIVGDMELAIECKSSRETRAADLKGLRALSEEHKIQRKLVVSRDRKRRTTDDRIEILPWREFCEELWAGGVI